MSVILETQVGDKIVVIQEFNASPEGTPFSWETSRRFRIGQRVEYARFFRDEHYANHPGLGWMVVFKVNGVRYAATQTQFVTVECWTALRNYFEQRKQKISKKSKARKQRKSVV